MTLDQLLRTGKRAIIDVTESGARVALVTYREGYDPHPREIACESDEMIECQEFAGQTVEQAIEAAAKLEGLPY